MPYRATISMAVRALTLIGKGSQEIAYIYKMEMGHKPSAMRDSVWQ